MDRPVNYEQTDSRWRNTMYSNHGDRAQTIGLSGCGPTCAAMVIATLANPGITPVDTCAWSVKNGYRTDNNGTKWAYFRPQMAAYGISCDDYTTDANKAIEAIKAGLMVIALAQKGIWTSSGHYILAYAVEGDKVLINDPNDPTAAGSLSGRERAPLATFRAQCVKFWVVRKEWRDDEVPQIRYKTLEEVPDWGKKTVEKLIKNKSISDPKNIDLSQDMLRVLVMLDRDPEI